MKTIRVKKNEEKTIIIDKSGEYEIQLSGENAHAQILGVFIGRKDEQFTIHTRQLHKAANTTSDLLIKSVLYDSSRLNYDGLIKIEKQGQGSDAYQRNENLVMNENVRVDTKPELEILANSVRCTHGATVGKINKDQLFYLQSRGLSTKQAQKLIIEGFFESVIEKIKDHQLQKKVRDKINKKLNYAQ